MAKEIGLGDIKLDKRKGQYILMDEKVMGRLINYADLKGKQTVLEIGPGLGGLTLNLAKKTNKVVAIEKDPRLYSYLKNKIPQNVELINADVMKIAFPDFDIVVSNLPYQISSPVTFKLLEYGFEKALLMYQKEFAERMTAECGDKNYSRLSVNVYYRAHCKILEFVSRKAFYPIPEVDSAIVELIPREPPFSVVSEKNFFKVLESLFAQRRKKIKNSLEGFVAKELRKIEAHNKSAIKDIIQSLPFINERVERLSPEKIGELADCLYLLIYPKEKYN